MRRLKVSCLTFVRVTEMKTKDWRCKVQTFEMFWNICIFVVCFYIFIRCFYIHSLLRIGSVCSPASVKHIQSNLPVFSNFGMRNTCTRAKFRGDTTLLATRLLAGGNFRACLWNSTESSKLDTTCSLVLFQGKNKNRSADLRQARAHNVCSQRLSAAGRRC